MRWVARQPFLRIALLQAANAWNRRRRTVSGGLAVLASIAVACAIAGAFDLLPQISTEVPTYLDEHAGWLLLLALLHAAFTASRSRRTLQTTLRDSWIAVTPRAALTMQFTIAIGVAWSVLWQLVVALVLFGLLALLAPHASFSHAIGALIAGASVGASLGVWFSKPSRKFRRPGSRYVPKSFEKPHARRKPDLRALAHWPIASAFAAADPRTLRWPVVVVAMSSVMGGSSIAAGLGVVGFWMLLFYMGTLYRSTLRTAHDAAEWLRSTPLGFTRLAIAVGTRSFVHQCIAALLIGGYLLTEHLTVLQALHVASLWMVYVFIAYTTSIAYSYSNRRGARYVIAGAVVVLATLESFRLTGARA